jgi:diguanylate cyclase (GGDEF)-like protein
LVCLRRPDLLDELNESPYEIAGVADFDLSLGILGEARKRGIFVTQNYTELLEKPDIDIILNLIPDKTVEAVIQQMKSDRAEVIHAFTSSFLHMFLEQTLVKRAITEMVSAVSRFLVGILDQRGFLGLTLRKVLEVTGAHGASLWVRRGNDFVSLQAKDLPTQIRQIAPSVGSGSFFDRLLERRRSLWIEDIAMEISSETKIMLEMGLQSLLMLPLIQDLEVKGALIVFDRRPSRYSREQVEAAEALAMLLPAVLEREGLRQGARELLIRDEVTELYNDVYFLDRLRSEIKRANRSESVMSLLYLAAGEQNATDHADLRMIRPYLRAIGSALMAALRDVDVPARQAGKDFVVILPETSLIDALKVGERVMARLSTVDVEGIGRRAIDFSIGVVSYPEHSANADELLDKAELAASLAAKRGKNQIRPFPTDHMALNGLCPDAIIRKYPAL